jgi:hypothetical protein
LIVETVLWGLAGFLLEVAVNLGGLSNISNAEFPNAPGNEIGLF